MARLVVSASIGAPSADRGNIGGRGGGRSFNRLDDRVSYRFYVARNAIFAIDSRMRWPILPDGKHLGWEMYRILAMLLTRKTAAPKGGKRSTTNWRQSSVLLKAESVQLAMDRLCGRGASAVD